MSNPEAPDLQTRYEVNTAILRARTKRMEELTSQLAAAQAALKDYKESKGPTGYPRWCEDEIMACRKDHGGHYCDSEDLCNKHADMIQQALAAIEGKEGK